MAATDTDRRTFLAAARKLRLTRATQCPSADLLVQAWFQSQPGANIQDLIALLQALIALMPMIQPLIDFIDSLKPAARILRATTPRLRQDSPTALLQLVQLLAESCTKPPEPAPVPPEPTTGLVALFVYDDEALHTLPTQTQSILSSRPLRDYLDSACAIAPPGPAMYRFLESGADLSREQPAFQALWLQPRTTLPWLYLQNGPHLFTGPWPADPPATIALAKQYA